MAGFLTIHTLTANGFLAVPFAHIVIRTKDGQVLYTVRTDESGNTEMFSLDAPDRSLTLDPCYMQPAYAVYDVRAEADGFKSVNVYNVEIVDGEESFLNIEFHPLEQGEREGEEEIDIPPIGLLIPAENRQITAPYSGLREVFIPEYITVHLGTPQNTSAQNVRVPFVEYVANVASSEIYSDWPYNSLLANVHCIVTFALNRIYTEWYRSRGYNFDITNSTQYDQYFVYGRNIFQNLMEIARNYYNVYARRFGFRNPFFTQYCNGTTSTCAGLSQWGTVTLANRGFTPLQILHYYYPSDLELIRTDNIQGIVETYPGQVLTIGSTGYNVTRIQNFLNRIRVNFPVIPQISLPLGTFNQATQNAVRVFQRQFDLTADGIVGRQTWNEITRVYTGVVKLGELNGEGERVGIGQTPPNVVLRQGARGEAVLQLQYILNVIASYYESVPPVIIDSNFGADTKTSVIDFQRAFGLNPDGIVGSQTWVRLYSVYHGIDQNAPPPVSPERPVINFPSYSGVPLRQGSSGVNVRLIQGALNVIRAIYPGIPGVAEDGIFGPLTRNAVVAFQRQFLLTPDGIVGPVTWAKLAEMTAIVSGLMATGSF
jgi:peptidoglycan hydrolase-like protein with peptidoglycan-binding domain